MKAKRNITTSNKSIIKKLKDQHKINDSILTQINNLSIEDLLAVKLELSSAHMNNRLYGFDIWKQSNNIVKEALLKFAISTTKSKKDAARFLGLTYVEFKRVASKYDIDNFFSDDL
tara:strand:+ start:494 stop:841 length:348 start_codon:yes stop_codon:yes gene_type:complete